MCWIEIPNVAVCEEVRARLDVDPKAIVFTEVEPRAARKWRAVCFAFSVGVATGWLWRFSV